MQDQMMNGLLLKFFELIGNDVAKIAGEIVGALKRDNLENSPFYQAYSSSANIENGQPPPKQKKAEIIAFRQPEQLCSTTTTDEEKGIFEITQKEMEKMLKNSKTNVKGRFFTKGFAVCWRKRQTGKYTVSYNVRFNRDGIHIDFCVKTKTEMKERFLSELKSQILNGEEKCLVPNTFDEFAEFYFENVKKKKVCASTFKSILDRYNRYLKPKFKGRKIKSILPIECQRIIDEIVEQNHSRTAEDVHSVLSGIFDYAIKNYIIDKNPISAIVRKTHERKHGNALTKEEERKLLLAFDGTSFKLYFAIALYTGLRPNEYKSARIDGNFIVAINSKRHNNKVEYKKIPITPMLQPYLTENNTFCFPYENTLRKKMKTVLPNHILYDLRTTFYTRCQECGVAPAARDEFVGHSHGRLETTYTDLSDEFLLNEGKKLNY